MCGALRQAVLVPLVLALRGLAPAQDLPPHLPAPPPRLGAAEVLESVAVPGTGFRVSLAACSDEIVVLRSGRLLRLPRGSEEWKVLGPAPEGTVAIAGHERELWAVDEGGGVTVLDPATGTAVRQSRLPSLPLDGDRALGIASIAFTTDSILVCAVGEPPKSAARRAKSILRLTRGKTDAAWLVVVARDGDPEGVGIEASTGAAVVAQGDCAVWPDPRGVPASAAPWSGHALAFALDGPEGVVLVAPRAAEGAEVVLWLRRLRLTPRPCVSIELVREGDAPADGANPRIRGILHWTVAGVRCDTRPALVAALDEIAARGDGPVALVEPRARSVYRDVADILTELRQRKLPVVLR